MITKLIVWTCLAASAGLVTLDILHGRATPRVLLVCLLLSTVFLTVVWF